jgi:hypothetical protein
MAPNTAWPLSREGGCKRGWTGCSITARLKSVIIGLISGNIDAARSVSSYHALQYPKGNSD